VLGRWDVADLAVEADGVVPFDPLDDRDLGCVAGAPRAVELDELGF